MGNHYPTGTETPVSVPLVAVDNAVDACRTAGVHLKRIDHYAMNDGWAQTRIDLMDTLRETLGKLNEAGETLLKLERTYRGQHTPPPTKAPQP